MNLGWGPSYLEFKNAGTNLSKISSTASAQLSLEGAAPGQNVRVLNVADPVAPKDASNKDYVDTKLTTGVVKTDNSTQQKTGLFTFTNTTDSTIETDGALVVSGGMGVGLNLNVGERVSADSFLVTSDATLKTQVENIESPLSKVRGVKAAQYRLRGQDKVRFGVLAQDLEANGLPELVEDLADHKAVDYNGLIGVLLGAIKELDDEVTFLKSKLVN